MNMSALEDTGIYENNDILRIVASILSDVLLEIIDYFNNTYNNNINIKWGFKLAYSSFQLYPT